MGVAVKNNNKTPLVVPLAVRRKAGFKSGQELEFKASGGVITIVPKLPGAGDEYTPEQRRAIDAQLDEAEKRPFYGPFETAGEMIAHMKRELRKRGVALTPAEECRAPRRGATPTRRIERLVRRERCAFAFRWRLPR